MGLSDQTIAVMKMKGITMDTMLDLLAPLPPSESQQNIDLNQKPAGDSGKLMNFDSFSNKFNSI